MKKTRLRIFTLFMTLLGILFLTGCSLSVNFSTPSAPASTAAPLDKAQIYYLDVGQGDAELIRLPTGENILIDAGLKSGDDQLTAYLKELGISRLDILIATHPHADHIGGMEAVVQNFEIGEIYMPKIADDQVPTTVTYTRLLEAIQAKNMKINQAKAGETIFDNGSAVLEILAPNSIEYKDLNDYSIVTKLTYGNNRFLFMGDAEKTSEIEMLLEGYDLSCDILKLGHHGSSTSTTDRFLAAASPSAAIVSCGRDNDYGHPHKETMEKLNSRRVTVYRTDTDGTILAESDGNTYTVTTNLTSVSKDA